MFPDEHELLAAGGPVQPSAGHSLHWISEFALEHGALYTNQSGRSVAAL